MTYSDLWIGFFFIPENGSSKQQLKTCETVLHRTDHQTRCFSVQFLPDKVVWKKIAIFESKNHKVSEKGQ